MYNCTDDGAVLLTVGFFRHLLGVNSYVSGDFSYGLVSVRYLTIERGHVVHNGALRLA